MATIHRRQANVQAIAYDEHARVRVSLPPSRLDGFCNAIIEASGNRARIEVER
jgi:hypothetical protein